MDLIVRNLTKQYKDKCAVDGVSLRLTEGINGVDVSSEDYRAVLGYLPQDFGYYPDFTGLDFLLYLAALKGLSRSHAKRKVGELLELVSLQDAGKKKIKT